MNERVYSFTHGDVQSWPQREQPIVVTFYAAFKHGPSDEQYVPYMSQNLNLTLDAAKSLIATMSKAIAHAEQGPRVGTPARLIAAAPTMYEYIEYQAEQGDAEAKIILEKIARAEEK